MEDVLKSMRFDNGVEVLDGFVVSVSEDEQTCTVNIAAEGEESIELPGIALRSVDDGSTDGIRFVPAVGAHVVFARIEAQSDYVLLKTSKILKVLLNCDEIVINEGLNKGMLKLDAVLENLNSIKKYVEQMNSALPAAFTAVGTGAAANGGTASASYQSAMAAAVIKLENMENTKIKH